MRIPVALGLFSLLAVSTASATVLCTARSGSSTLRVRAVCRTNETQVDPVALGLQGPQGPTGPAGPPASHGAGNIVASQPNGGLSEVNILRNDGHVFTLYANGTSDEYPELQPPIPLSSIVSWYRSWLLDTSGDLWFFHIDHWQNMGHP